MNNIIKKINPKLFENTYDKNNTMGPIKPEPIKQYDFNRNNIVQANKGELTSRSSDIKAIVSSYKMPDLDKAAELTNSSNTQLLGPFDYGYEAEYVDEVDLKAVYNQMDQLLGNTIYKNLEGFNKHINDNVHAAGYGTKQGVIAAIMSLAYDFPEATGYKFFYTAPQGYTMREATDGIVPCKTNLDCRGLIQWAIHNGGYDTEVLNLDRRQNFEEYAEANGMVKSDINSAQVGDVFSGNGYGSNPHIWMVVGTYDGGYYIAEEYGVNHGLVINKLSFEEHAERVKEHEAKLYDMSKFYSNPNNVREENK